MYAGSVTTRAPALPPEQRRQAIIAATLPLLLERGANISTREIADAAGIAEGTIFGVFPDKEAVVQAALRAAFDPEPTERALDAIDRSLPFEEQLEEAVDVMQRRFADIWRLVSTVGDPGGRPTPPRDFAALSDIFEATTVPVADGPGDGGARVARAHAGCEPPGARGQMRP